MGPERLRVVVAAFALAACSTPPRPREAAAPPHPPHVQIVPALTTPARRALVERLRQRNPDPPAWTVNDEALGESIAVVDPFAGFLRRARRGDRGDRGDRGVTRSPAIDPEQATAAARAFVTKNADLLGLPRHVVVGLAESARSVAPSDHASPRAAYVVRFEAPFSSKGYEGFKELDNVAELDVNVDDDGEVSAFANLSRIHPRITIDTKPLLGGGEPRVVAQLVGRKVFALALDPEAPAGDVRTLGRVPLGEVEAADVTHVQLIVHASPGPRLAWMTYRLAYFVEVTKAEAFFFRYVVDADTGDVLEDTQVPLSPPADE